MKLWNYFSERMPSLKKVRVQSCIAKQYTQQNCICKGNLTKHYCLDRSNSYVSVLHNALEITVDTRRNPQTYRYPKMRQISGTLPTLSFARVHRRWLVDHRGLASPA